MKNVVAGEKEFGVQEPLMFEVGFAPGESICPLCGEEMDVAGDLATCLNSMCPHVTDTAVYDVVNALRSIGYGTLDAAKMAGLYSTSGLAEDLEEDGLPTSPDYYAVSSEFDANRVLKRLARAESQLDAIEAMADEEVEAIRARAAKISRPIRARIDFIRNAFGANLRQWAQEQLAGQKKKSIDLLFGRIGFRKKSDLIVVDDEDKAIQWLIDGGFNHAVKVSLRRREFAELYRVHAATASELEGFAHIEEGADEFYLKPEDVTKEGGAQ